MCLCLGNRGVAVGSSIGHAIGGFFGGGSAAAPAEAQQQQADMAPATNAYGDAAVQTTGGNEWGARSCEVDARQFTKCLDENAGNMQICGWYLDQLVSFSLILGVWRLGVWGDVWEVCADGLGGF